MFYRKGANGAFEREDWEAFAKVFKQIKKHSLQAVYESECERFYEWRSRNNPERDWFPFGGKLTFKQRRAKVRKILYALRIIKGLINDPNYKVVPPKHKSKGPGSCSLLQEDENEKLERTLTDKELEIRKLDRWG